MVNVFARLLVGMRLGEQYQYFLLRGVVIQFSFVILVRVYVKYKRVIEDIVKLAGTLLGKHLLWQTDPRGLNCANA